MSIWDDLAEAWEDFFDFLDHPKYTMGRSTAKELAAKYNLKDDGEAFEELWGLTINASILEKQNHDAAIEEVERMIRRLSALVNRAPDENTTTFSPESVLDEPGLRFVHVAPAREKYVIFSDHHMLYDGSRQNYFVTNGNKRLYTEILGNYYAPNDFNLVENGDVEELIILEPELSEINNIHGWDWDEVFAYRNSKKKPQLTKIVRDNIDYYEALYDGFIVKERYFKITGNHDRDMCDPDFARTVGDILGRDWPVACDVLLLKSGASTDYIICHGHQFDTACTPKFAAKAGESFSQSASWAYQGPDRIWRTQYDQMGDWLSGREPVLDNLVSDLPETGGFWGDGGFQQLWDAMGAALENLNTERGWETLYGKNIAWNYFKNEGDPQKCIDLEVKTGKRWFKFRHMNEFRLVEGLQSAFGSHIPTLVLGHTHEPRLRPRATFLLPGLPSPVAEIGFYANSGSAGRFENLIWGMEILEREPILVSWHRGEDGLPIRTVWEPYTQASAGFLRPASSETLQDVHEPAAYGLDVAPILIAANHLD